MYIPKPDSVNQKDWDDAWNDWDICFKRMYKKQFYIMQGLGYDIKLNHKGPFKAPNGITYKTAEDMRAEYGWYPYYFKDGIFYGLYELLRIYKIDNLPMFLSEKTERVFAMPYENTSTNNERT